MALGLEKDGPCRLKCHLRVVSLNSMISHKVLRARNCFPNNRIRNNVRQPKKLDRAGTPAPPAIRKVSRSRPARKDTTQQSSGGDRPLKGLLAKGLGYLGDAIGSWSEIPGLGALLGYGGNWVGNKLGQVFGFGKYYVRGNTLAPKGMIRPDVWRNLQAAGAIYEGNQLASIATFGNGQGVRIRHREFITNIRCDTDFTSLQFTLNPGLSKTFPWLSKNAKNYKKWIPHGILFQYISSSGDQGGDTPALGSVIMSTVYDAGSAPMTSKQQMESQEHSISGKPSLDIVHTIECDPLEKQVNTYLVRGDGYLLMNEQDSQYQSKVGSMELGDLKFYDHGVTQVATDGMSDSYVVGGLWISYDITLLDPLLPPPENLMQFATWGSTSGVDPVNFFNDYNTLEYEASALGVGAESTVAFGGLNSLGFSVLPAGNEIVFNTPGQYIVMIGVDTNAKAAFTFDATLSNGIVNNRSDGAGGGLNTTTDSRIVSVQGYTVPDSKVKGGVRQYPTLSYKLTMPNGSLLLGLRVCVMRVDNDTGAVFESFLFSDTPPINGMKNKAQQIGEVMRMMRFMDPSMMGMLSQCLRARGEDYDQDWPVVGVPQAHVRDRSSGSGVASGPNNIRIPRLDSRQ